MAKQKFSTIFYCSLYAVRLTVAASLNFLVMECKALTCSLGIFLFRFSKDPSRGSITSLPENLAHLDLFPEDRTLKDKLENQVAVQTGFRNVDGEELSESTVVTMSKVRDRRELMGKRNISLILFNNDIYKT